MIPINSITICPENITITEGKWYYGAYAEICPTNATCKCLTWHSSNSNVASVNQNGYICGVSEGTAVIYAIAQDGSGAVGFCNVTVKSSVKVARITVTPTTKTASVGSTFTLSATVCPDNAEDKRVRWTSYDDNIAEVDYTRGIVTAKSAGTVNVCAYAIDGSGVSACCRLTVKNVPVSSVTITPASKIMAVGSATTLTANVLPANATNKTIVWSSSDENIATVIPSTGYVLAKKPGTTNICAFSQDGSNQYMNCTITVNDLYDIDNDSWEEMGFKYGNNESFNVNHNLPPISYQNWILNGRQKAIYVCDYDVLRIVGHAILLIRGKDGVWYKTELIKTGIDRYIIDYRNISEDTKNNYINSDNKECVFLYGDYTESLEKAQYYSEFYDSNNEGDYSLFNNNCLHYVNEILSFSDNINNDIDTYFITNRRDAPCAYYDDLIELIG